LSAEKGSHIARHEWKGISKTAGNLEDWVQRQREEEADIQGQRRRSARLAQRRVAALNMPGFFDESDADDA
jgi:WD repeat-containing protein 23